MPFFPFRRSPRLSRPAVLKTRALNERWGAIPRIFRPSGPAAPPEKAGLCIRALGDARRCKYSSLPDEASVTSVADARKLSAFDEMCVGGLRVAEDARVDEGAELKHLR